MIRRILLNFIGVFVAGSGLSAQEPKPDRAAKWEKEIAAIEKRLTATPPMADPILFAGSSSIRLWEVTKAFPKSNVVNVGFGGSEVRDTTHFVERIVLKWKPKAIVLYAGDNDIANGRTPRQVSDDFKELVNTVHAKLPQTTIHFIAVKPSPSRMKLFDKQTEANKLVKSYCQTDAKLNYIDVVPVMLMADGQPNPELFQKDNLHLNEKGYALWTTIIGKAIE